MNEDLEHYSKASSETASRLVDTLIHVIESEEVVCCCDGECWRWEVLKRAIELQGILKVTAK